MMNDKLEVKIKQGELIKCSSGEYSDYYVVCILRALVDIDPSEIRSDYLLAHPKEVDYYSFDSDKFINYILNILRIVEEVEIQKVWHLDNYSKIDDMYTYELKKSSFTNMGTK